MSRPAQRRVPRWIAVAFAPALAAALLAAGSCTDETDDTTAVGAGGSGGGAGEGGTGGVGGEPVSLCEPGATIACFDGPESARNQGACKDGQGVCNAQGDGILSCEGQTLPRTEDCLSGVDEDCNGENNDLCPDAVHHLTVAVHTPGNVALGSDSSIHVAGTVAGTLLVDGTSIDCVDANRSQALVAKLNADGSHGWVKCMGALGYNDQAHDVAVADNGDVWAIGAFYSSIDLGNGLHNTVGNYDAFVARWDVDGNWLMDAAFGSTHTDIGESIAVNADGSAIVGGQFRGSGVYVGNGGNELASYGNQDVFVAKIAPNGDALWSASFAGTADEQDIEVAVLPDGDVIAGFRTNSSFELLGEEAGDVHGGWGIVIVRLSVVDGGVLWAKTIGGNLDQDLGGIAVDDSGIVVAGAFDAVLALDDGKLAAVGRRDMFVVKLDATSGDELWHETAGVLDAYQWAGRIAVGADGNITVTGTAQGELVLADKAVRTGDAEAALLWHLDADGTQLWARAFTGEISNGFRAVAADASSIVALGHFDYTLAIGSSGQLAPDGFVLARLSL